MSDNNKKQPATTKKSSRLKTWLRRISYTFLVLLICVVILLSILLGTHGGLKFLLFRLPEMAKTHISAENLQGTVWRGFSAKNISIKTDSGGDINLSSLLFDWDSSKLFKKRLIHIRKLELGELHIVSSSNTPKKESEPTQMPSSVGIPLFDAQVDIASIKGVFLGKEKEEVLGNTALKYSYLENKHNANIIQLNTIWAKANGQIELENKKPFVVGGNVSLNGKLNDEPAQGNINLSGSLKDLGLNLDFESNNAVLEGEVALSPFAQNIVEKVKTIKLTAGNINPKNFMKSLPDAKLFAFVGINPDETNQHLENIISVVNENPLTVDKNGIPIRNIHGNNTLHENGLIQISDLSIDLMKDGVLSLSGNISKDIDLSAKVENFLLSDIITSPSRLEANGEVKITGKTAAPLISWNLNRGQMISKGEVSLEDQQQVQLKNAQILDNKGGEINLSGNLKLDDKQAFEANINAKGFNPEVVHDNAPSGNINGNLSLNGELKQQIIANSILSLKNSVLSGMPFSADGDLHYAKNHLEPSKVKIVLGQNNINANGTFGLANDKLNLDVNAPNLALFGFGLNGGLNIKGTLAGEPQHIKADLVGSANQFAFQDTVKLQKLEFKVLASPDLNAPLNINIDGQGLIASSVDISRIQAAINGSQAKHQLSINTHLTADKKTYQADVAAAGGLNADYRWDGIVSKLNLNGPTNIILENPVKLVAGKDIVQVGNANWRVLGGQLNLQSLLWQPEKGVITKGRANNIQLAQLKNIIEMSLEQNLVMAADWDIQYNNNPRGVLNIQHISGDVTIPGKKRTIGLSKLALHSELLAGKIHNSLLVNTAFGNADAKLDIAQKFGGDFANAPISGNLKIISENLSTLKAFLPPDTDLAGNLIADTTIRGTLSDPLLSGSLNGEKLRYRSWDTGATINNGTLKSRFDGKEWIIDSLNFNHDRTGGKIDITGKVVREGFLPLANLHVNFDHYPVLRHPDRRVVVSGTSDIEYAENRGLTLLGSIKLDEALFDFPKAGMPSVSDDVVVLGEDKNKDSSPLPLNMNINLDLNDAFKFSGKGLNVLMGGQLNLVAKPEENMRLVGAVNVVSGRYKAYGQDLEIEHGQIAFMGPVDNPSLNIKAKRRMSPVGAGVEVKGTVNQPRVVLIADDPMSDKDKLAWLILGRSAAQGDEAALAAAAGSMLAGGINDKVGLFDDIGLTSKEAKTDNNTGAVNPAEQMVTVGKHVSSKIYLGYEYGLSSTTQAVKVIYQLGKAVQLIGRAGTDSSGGEIRYSKRFD